jgi:DMSO/TMAO reductase YedYZ molybdopterin-dependent catalytic subunit
VAAVLDRRRLRAVLARLPLATLAVGLAAGVAAVAASYAVAGFTPGFVTAPVAAVLTDRMPGAVVTFAILVLGDLGKLLNLAAALALSAGVLAAAALVGAAAGRRTGVHLLVPVAAGVAPAGVAFLLTGAQAPSIAAGAAAGVVVAGGVLADRTATGDRGLGAASRVRRRVLGGVATGAAFTFGGFVLGGGSTSLASDLDVSTETAQETDSLLREANDKSLAVDGLEPLVSDGFYTVDVASVDPTPDLDSWEVTVTGDVEEEVSYDYDDITAMDAQNRVESLRCVGEGLNGQKLDTAVWQGVPIRDLIDPAGVPDNCCVMLRAADGFYEEFPLDALDDAMLAYGMNGEVLPRGHGYPARALVPGHWGEINVKWLTEIEILEGPQTGYWEERGWHGTGPVNTVAKLHVVNDLDDGRKQVAGHAYAGTRGIQRVEVSIDGGDTWTDARLSDPLPGDDVWRQWAYEYESPGESHEVVVRATDGTGTLQPSERQDAFPSGPTGWVSKTVDG